MGSLLAVQVQSASVQSASVQDPVGAPPVITEAKPEAKQRAPQLQLLWGDGR